jgi:hypothetical protein
MPSASITVRKTKGGRRRYAVRFRVGGRAYPVEHGGSFPTMREARIRRDLIAGQLAAGRNPQEVLRRLARQPKARTLEQVFEDLIASRVDVAPATLENYKTARGTARADSGLQRPAHGSPAGGSGGDWETVGPLPRFGADLRRTTAPGARLRGLRSKPGQGQAREAAPKRIHYPRSAERVSGGRDRRQRSHYMAPCPSGSRADRDAGGRARQTRMADVDQANSRFRIRAGKTAASRRWVAVPEWVMEDVLETCPPDDRTP